MIILPCTNITLLTIIITLLTILTASLHTKLHLIAPHDRHVAISPKTLQFAITPLCADNRLHSDVDKDSAEPSKFSLGLSVSMENISGVLIAHSLMIADEINSKDDCTETRPQTQSETITADDLTEPRPQTPGLVESQPLPHQKPLLLPEVYPIFKRGSDPKLQQTQADERGKTCVCECV